MQGVLCSLEGISGVGKSYLAHILKEVMVDVPVTFVSEVVDRHGRELDREIIAVLAASKDRFFRGGKPLTETFLLLALKMFDFETCIAPFLAEGHVVIEDRSLDTIAIYQALIRVRLTFLQRGCTGKRKAGKIPVSTEGNR